MATRTSVATGNWSAGGTWDTGVPGSADDAVIANGHVVTKDTAAGSPDCATVVVNSGGTLAIGSNGLKTSGAFTNNGTLTGGANGSLWAVGDYTLAGMNSLTGTAGNLFTLRGGNGTCSVYGSRGSSSRYFKLAFVAFTDFDRLHPHYASWNDYFNDCTFVMSGNQGLWPSDTFPGVAVVFRRCTFDGSSAGSKNFVRGPRVPMFFYDCAIGLTTKFNTIVNPEGHSPLRFYNSPYDANSFFASNHTEYVQAHPSVGCDGGNAAEIGMWAVRNHAGLFKKSVAAVKTGTFGISIAPSPICDTAILLRTEILIPIASGASVTPSLYYKNVTADLDLEAAAERLTVVCDPGDEWGLNQTIDVNGAADSYNNWRQIAFTGGTAAGSGKVGFLRISFRLARYVSTAVVYVADVSDGTTTYDPEYGDEIGAFGVPSGGSASILGRNDIQDL